MIPPTQLALDLSPYGAVAVRDRVRVLASLTVTPGMTGTVVRIAPRRIPCRDVGYWEAYPVAATIDQLDGRVYAFEYEDLERVG